MRPVIPIKAISKWDSTNPDVIHLNLTTASLLTSRYKHAPGMMKIAKAIPTFNQRFVSNQFCQGTNHKNNHATIANRIQMTDLAEWLARICVVSFLKDCSMDTCIEPKVC